MENGMYLSSFEKSSTSKMVAVWLKTDDQLQYMGTLKGRRTTLVDPKEITGRPKRNFQCCGDFHIETFKGDSGFIFRYAFSIPYVHT